MTDGKKPFKETKVGKFLKIQAPKILDVVGDVLPDKGLLGIVKNLISQEEGLTPAEKAEALAKVQEFELELEKLTQVDRAGARTREVGFVQALGHVDWMMYFTGIIGLAAFAFILYVLVYISIPEHNRDLFIHAIGMVEGVAVSIFSYYFGSSKGSTDKTKLLKS